MKATPLSALPAPLFALLLGLMPLIAVAQPTPAGGDFQINSYTTGFQSVPSVAMDDAGRFVVVWESMGSPGSDDDDLAVLGRRFDSRGSAIGGDFQVNGVTTGRQTYPQVAMHPGGAFVVVWDSRNLAEATFEIAAQRYASDGTALGDQLVVNSYSTSFDGEAAVSVLQNGDFVVAWSSYDSPGNDSSFDSVQARLFASDGSVVGDQFQVNTYTTLSQGGPAIAHRPDGGFVIVWESNGSGGSDTSSGSIQGQIFEASGTPVGDQFEVNTFTTGLQRDPRVATDGEGGFTVVWKHDDTGSSDIRGQIYDSAGVPVGGELTLVAGVLGTEPVAAPAASGGFVVVWRSSLDSQVHGQRFDAAGSALSAELAIGDGSEVEADHTVSSRADGAFAILWRHGLDTLRARLYDSSGTPTTPSFEAATFALGGPNAGKPSAALAEDGRLLVTWTEGVV